MPLRQTWLALSISRSTVMLAPTATSIVVPPLGEKRRCGLGIELGSGASFDATDVWVAITCEDGTHA